MTPRSRSHRRSWRNLLINKRYQLRFTLFMVGLTALLMAGLGRWVLEVAETSNTVASNNLYGAMEVECREPRPAATSEPAAAPTPAAAASAPRPAEPAGRERRQPVVTIDETMMPEAAATPVAPAVDAAALARFDACRERYAAAVTELGRRKQHIVWAMLASGLVLLVGLTLYGIKMTHRVAGPLHKVQGYLEQLKQGDYPRVYALRKGDHLVDFYEHFRAAHAGVRRLQAEDIARIRAAVEAADEVDLASRSPEIAATLAELRAILSEKERSFEQSIA